MLAQTVINNTEANVYTVPTNKNVLLFVEIYPLTTEPNCIVKINNYIYWNGTLYGLISLKLALTDGDTIKVSTNGQVNVFVHGIVS